MKIRALKTTTGLPRGCVADVDDYEARELIAQGYAIEELHIAEQEAAPANDNRPLSIGGLTGADVPPSLSPVGQVLQQREFGVDADSQESDSLPSTTDTDSAPGQTSSTPVTTTGGKRKRGRPRSKA